MLNDVSKIYLFLAEQKISDEKLFETMDKDGDNNGIVTQNEFFAYIKKNWKGTGEQPGNDIIAKFFTENFDTEQVGSRNNFITGANGTRVSNKNALTANEVQAAEAVITTYKDVLLLLNGIKELVPEDLRYNNNWYTKVETSFWNEFNAHLEEKKSAVGFEIDATTIANRATAECYAETLSSELLKNYINDFYQIENDGILKNYLTNYIETNLNGWNSNTDIKGLIENVIKYYFAGSLKDNNNKPIYNENLFKSKVYVSIINNAVTYQYEAYTYNNYENEYKQAFRNFINNLNLTTQKNHNQTAVGNLINNNFDKIMEAVNEVFDALKNENNDSQTQQQPGETQPSQGENTTLPPVGGGTGDVIVNNQPQIEPTLPAPAIPTPEQSTPTTDSSTPTTYNLIKEISVDDIEAIKAKYDKVVSFFTTWDRYDDSGIADALEDIKNELVKKGFDADILTDSVNEVGHFYKILLSLIEVENNDAVPTLKELEIPGYEKVSYYAQLKTYTNSVDLEKLAKDLQNTSGVAITGQLSNGLGNISSLVTIGYDLEMLLNKVIEKYNKAAKTSNDEVKNEIKKTITANEIKDIVYTDAFIFGRYFGSSDISLIEIFPVKTAIVNKNGIDFDMKNELSLEVKSDNSNGILNIHNATKFLSINGSSSKIKSKTTYTIEVAIMYKGEEVDTKEIMIDIYPLHSSSYNDELPSRYDDPLPQGDRNTVPNDFHGPAKEEPYLR